MNPAHKASYGKQAYRKPHRGRKPSTTDWLQILDIDGPFLAAPVITDTWPDGFPALDSERMNEFRAQSAIYDSNVGARDGYIRHILTSVLDWRTNLVWGPEATQYAVTVPEHQTTVEITFAMLGQDDQGTPQPDKPLLLGAVIPPGANTTGRAPAGGSWPASPADRLAHALRSRKVPLGLVINGSTWTLVTISTDGAVSTATWTRHGWLEEAETLRAFVAILDRKRFLGVGAKETLPGLLDASQARQEEVTERLSEQSQAVVEMLVATLGRSDAQHKAETGHPLLPAEVGPAEVYQATVTVLMRLVFLLYAEERGLLPLDDDTYASTYAVSTLANELRDRATEQGEDALERTSVGWHRLLAVFRAVHRGVRHEQLLLPAYGGSLCDPDRYPWLEGRTSPDEPLGSQHVPAVDDRTLLRALDSIQTLQFAKERRQVSYRSLDVEQIGYVYEGLLAQDARRAEDWVVSIAVSERDLRKNGPELALTDLETHHQHDDDTLATWLHEQTKNTGTARSKTSILKALQPPVGDELAQHSRLIREASGNDDDATERLMPYCRLLRLDPRDLPVIYPPGSLYLTDSDARANTGAVYTPKFLAEQVVIGALEPLAYNPGPLDTEDKATWRIKTPEQILALKVADIAAGSGAFLVAATRYLAGKLLEARLVHTPTPQLTEPSDPSPEATPVQPQLGTDCAEQDELDARRAIIDHCIYGVDINPMAIEMAKLSLWLITLDRNRPFGFLDDRLAVGDSLLGITNADQITALHLDPKAGRRLRNDTLELFTSDTGRLLKEAAEIRQQIAEIDLRDTRDADHKARLLEQARAVTNRVSLVADGLSAASLAGGTDGQYVALASKVADTENGKDPNDLALVEHVNFGLTRPDGSRHHPAHFPLLFPEVFSDGRTGFDAVVGNPPFLGGKKISAALGSHYREQLVRVIAHGETGSVDLMVFMLLRGAAVTATGSGQLGMIATKSLAEGVNRRVGLEKLCDEPFDLRAAVRSKTWPTAGANLSYCIIWASRKGRAAGVRAVADGVHVESIGPDLRPTSRVSGATQRLRSAQGSSFYGTVLSGSGFMLQEGEAVELLAADPGAELVVQPFLTGADLLGTPDSAATRFVINFQDWSLEQAQEVAPLALERVRRLVKPERDRVNRESYRLRWWQFAERCANLYAAIAGRETVLVVPQTGKYLPFQFTPAQGQVFAPMVFNFSKFEEAGVLNSTIHQAWVEKTSGTLDTRSTYRPTDSFETFVWPPTLEGLAAPAEAMMTAWRKHSASMGGMTRVLNAMHNANDAPMDTLRNLQTELDQQVLWAYGWTDLTLSHEFVESRQGSRFTLAPAVRVEILDRLLELNHQRYAEEVAAGLHDKGAKRSPRKKTQAADDSRTLFGGEPTLFGGEPNLFDEDA